MFVTSPPKFDNLASDGSLQCGKSLGGERGTPPSSVKDLVGEVVQSAGLLGRKFDPFRGAKKGVFDFAAKLA